MTANELKEKIFELHEWYQAADFDSMSDRERDLVITEKMKEFGFFDIDYEEVFKDENIPEEFSAYVHFLVNMYKQEVSAEEKTNQLFNNPFFFKNSFALGEMFEEDGSYIIENSLCGLFSLMVDGSVPYNRNQILEKLLEIIRYYSVNQISALIFSTTLGDIFSRLVAIPTDDEKRSDDLIIEILNSAIFKDKDGKNNSNISITLMEAMLSICHDEKAKMDFILRVVNSYNKQNDYNSSFRYSDDGLNCLIGTVDGLQNRLELSRKLIELDRKKGTKYYRSFMLYFVFSRADDKYNDEMEKANFLFMNFKNLLDDEDFKPFIDSYTLLSVADALRDDEVLLIKLHEIENDIRLSKFVDSNFIAQYIIKFSSGRKMLELSGDYLKKGLLNMKDFDSYILTRIYDRSLFRDFDLMKPIYEHPSFKTLFVNLVSDRPILHSREEAFRKLEERYKAEGRIPDLFKRYTELGIIDDDTLNDIFNIVSKYIPNLTMEDMIQRIKNNPNAIEIIQHFATSCNRNFRINGVDVYENSLKKFEYIFRKTRFQCMIDLTSFTKMGMETAENFNLKVWNKLIANPIFIEDENTKRALIEIIEVAGLFNNDPEVENRRKIIYEMFNDYRTPISEQEMTLLIAEEAEWLRSVLKPTVIKSYRLRDGVVIPGDLMSWFSHDMLESEMRELKRTDGSIGSKLTKFLSPYVFNGNVWVLRRDVNIDEFSNYLKPEMTKEEYDYIFRAPHVPEEVIRFLNPYEEIRTKAYVVHKGMSSSDLARVVDIILRSHLNNRFTFETIHRMFDGVDREFDLDFFQFFVKNVKKFLENPEYQRKFKDVKKKYQSIKRYYMLRGNANPEFEDFMQFLDSITFAPDFGNEEFAEEAKNAKVSDEAFDFYQRMLEKTRKRKITTVPRHEKVYEYVDSRGKKYQILAKVLRSDDPFNMLVGESRYTNCCQVYGNVGQKCMEHAASSPNGGIFTLYLIVDGRPQLLTQSWFWTNEYKACLDNVEATSLLTSASGEERKLLIEIATFAIRKAAEDIIKSANAKLEEYIEKKTQEIMNSSMSEEEKQQELQKLEIMRARQTLRVVTVGENVDDLAIRQSFPIMETAEESMGPKGYNGYTDAGPGHQHVIIRDSEAVLPTDRDYEDVPIYRDERRIAIEKANEIRFESLKQIIDINDSKPDSMKKKYREKDGSVLIYSPELMALYYETDLENLRVIHGEDFYYIYENNDDMLIVDDFALGEPRLPDEIEDQLVDMTSGFEMIIMESIVLGENNEIIRVKPIKAILGREMLYILSLVKDQLVDVRMEPFNGEEDKYMVTFVPTKEEVRKLLPRIIEDNKKKGESYNAK